MKNKNRGHLFFRIGMLALCALLLSRFVDASATMRQLATLTIPCVLTVTALAMFHCWLTSRRWMLLNPDPNGQWHAFDYFRYTMISNTFNLVMPGALGGDFMRSLFVIKDADGHRTSNVLAIFVDRVVGLFSILLLGIVCGFFASSLINRVPFLCSMSGLMLVAVGGALAAMHEPLNDWLVDRIRSWGKSGKKLSGLFSVWRGFMDFYRVNRLRLLSAFFLCFVIHGIWFVVVFILASTLKIPIGFLELSMITAISWLITAVPITFGGLGVRELSFVVLLGTQGIPAEQATALSVAQFGIALIMAAFGIPFIWMNKRGQHAQPA